MRGERNRRGRWFAGGAVAAGVVVGLFVVAGMASALTGAGAHAASGDPKYVCKGTTPTLVLSVSGPAALTKPKLVLSVDWRVVNDEDGGSAGFWALDTYTIWVSLWLLTAGPYAHDYFWTQTESGIFQTFQGALSPNHAVVEPASGYGTMVMGAWGFVNNTTVEQFNPNSLPTYGNLGTKNYGGSTNSTLAGTYSVPGDTSMWFWYTAYFTPGYETDYTVGSNGGAWGYVYNLNSAFWTNPYSSTPSTDEYCIFGVGQSFVQFGDIVTAS